jgi:hypothetical protein
MQIALQTVARPQVVGFAEMPAKPTRIGEST